MSRIDGYNAYSQNLYETSKSKVANTTAKQSTAKTEASKTDTQVELSAGAKKLLEEIKQKYGNADIMVANYESDEEAQKYLSRGTKEYSVLFDPETLEAMAADEDTKKKYLGMLDDATTALKDIKDQIQEDGKEVTMVGVTVSGDGTLLFYAELEKSAEEQKERIEEHKEEKKAQQKEEKAKAAKEENDRKIKKTTVKASSIEELLEKIKGVNWDDVPVSEKKIAGGLIDFSV